MIFWIFVILTIIGIILFYLFDIEAIGLLTMFSSGMAVIIMLAFIIGNHCGADGWRLSNVEQYKALTYKAQTEACRDEFGIVTKEYIDEIQKWNMDLVKYQRYQRDFWIGIFYPNIFDEFQTIDIDSIKHKEGKQ